MLEPGQVMERLVSALRSLPGLVRGDGRERTSLLDLAADPASSARSWPR